MESQLLVEPLPILGVCNLCLNEGAVKSMLLTQKYEDKTLNYCEMLHQCFAIDISTMDLGDTKMVICHSCTLKLEDAATFRSVVETSLKTLELTAKENKTTLTIKCEPETKDDDELNSGDNDDDYDEEDDMLLICVKKEPEEQPKKIRKKTKDGIIKNNIKLKSLKTNNLAETEKLLDVGLFPFKIEKDRSFTCGVCPEKSNNLDNLKTHVKEHSKTVLHVAFKKMTFSKSLSIRFYKIGECLRCKLCLTDLNNYEELKAHIEDCKRLINTYKWNTLPFKLEKDQLDCPICKKRFLNFVSLNTHMNLHYPNFICESCGKAFASKARLRGHMRTHEIGHFPCRYCDAVFDRVTKRENHVSKEHKSGVRYACKRCNISLSSFYARQKHLAEVHNEELKRYKCKACPQSYITPGHLSSHVRRDHLNERNHQCDKCDLAFYTKNALKMHMIKHNGERIHTCSVCQKSYQRKKTLREHMRIHNNDRRFVCPVCGRAFTQKCTLKGHLKVHERKVELDDRIVQPLHSI